MRNKLQNLSNMLLEITNLYYLAFYTFLEVWARIKYLLRAR